MSICTIARRLVPLFSSSALLGAAFLPLTTSAQGNLGSLSGNGTLHRSIPIGGLPFGPLEITHHADFEGRGSDSVVSDWRVPALFSYAGPDGRKL